ncbi:MAG: aminoacyl-tRNA hydrolase [Coriobacteriales bacterium]|nr:aminoacyl-tRNA hydrolase [Coriobacteriales bacterium]
MSRDYLLQKQQHKKQAAQSGQTNLRTAANNPSGSAGGVNGASQSAKTEPIQLVCGLGNPGTEYEFTRHNIGYLTIDELARMYNASYWKTKPGALVTEITVDSRKIILVKPTAFMNVSGGPIKAVASEYRIPAAGILVVHDDLELAAGKVAVRFGGGLAGHNGLRSLSDKLTTPNFGRVRCGIGRPPGRMEPAAFVLKDTRGQERDELLFLTADAARACEYALMQGISQASAHFSAH